MCTLHWSIFISTVTRLALSSGGVEQALPHGLINLILHEGDKSSGICIDGFYVQVLSERSRERSESVISNCGTVALLIQS